MDGASDVDGILAKIDEVAGEHIEAMSPTVEVYGMLSFKYVGQYVTRPVTLIGIDPASKSLVSPLTENMGNYQAMLDEEGNAMPADIEFAFRDGELALLQIRPFVESSSALSNADLMELDGNTASGGNAFVPLDSIPRVARREKR